MQKVKEFFKTGWKKLKIKIKVFFDPFKRKQEVTPNISMRI